jgi:hypothetical protein
MFKNRNFMRFFMRLFSILATLWFLTLWFLSVVYFATLAMLNFVSWQYVALIWLILIGTCTVLWIIGNRREREAINPLHGIIPNPKTAGKPSDINNKKRSFAFWPLRN